MRNRDEGTIIGETRVRAQIQRMASYFLTRLSALAVCRLNIIQYHRQTKKGRQTMPTAKEGDCG